MNWLALTAGFATVVTVLVILAGSLVSLYSDDIKQSWPLRWTARGPISWPAVASWTSATLASLAYFARERFVERRDRDERTAETARQSDAQAMLVNQAKDLERLVRTMPPGNFLASFADAFKAADDTAGVALQPPFDLAQLTGAIRTVLRSIALLAKMFGGDVPSSRYATNVMIFRRIQDMSAADKVACSGRLHFCEPAVSLDNLAGVLDLTADWSASTDDLPPSGEPVTDARVKPLALPVPIVTRDPITELYKVLPGAPLTFVTGKPDIYADVRLMHDWCAAKGDFTASVRSELRRYFEDRSVDLRSFVSIPLARGGGVFAGLNIHCSDAGMLRDRLDAVIQFVTVLGPIQTVLVKLMRASGIAQSGPGPPADD